MLSWFQNPVHRLETGQPLAVLPLTQILDGRSTERSRTIKDEDEDEDEEDEESENGGEAWREREWRVGQQSKQIGSE